MKEKPSGALDRQVKEKGGKRRGEEMKSAPVRPSTLVTLTSLTGTFPESIFAAAVQIPVIILSFGISGSGACLVSYRRLECMCMSCRRPEFR